MEKSIKIFLAFFLGIITLSSCSKNEYESGGIVSPVINLGYVKALHNGDDVILAKEKLMGATQIAGIIISDKNNGNFKDNEFVLQNTAKGSTTGVIFSFTDNNNSFNVGDSVKINIENCVLYRENGAMKVKGNDLNFSKVTKIASGLIVKPKVLTLAQLYSGFFNYESTLVQINDVSFPDLQPGQVYEGEFKMGDQSNISVFLSTQSTANFAQDFLPLLATYVGIPTYYNPNSNYYNTAKALLKLRGLSDVLNVTGVVYPNFPEDFELAPASSKANYLMPEINDQVTFKTGKWKIYQGIIGAQINVDKFNPLGSQAIRLQKELSESAYLEMGFDLPNGATKVTFTYGTPELGGPVSSTFDLEYSTNGGLTWLKAGESISDAYLSNNKNAKQATYNLNIAGNVRFRINKLGLGLTTSTVSNGFLNIDDFKVYQNVD